MAFAKVVRDVSTPSEDYLYMEERRHLCRTLMRGTHEMRRQGTRYLPKEPKETNPGYQRRLGRTILKNQYKKTVKSLSGRPFSKPMVITTTNKEIHDPEGATSAITDNIDLQGNTAQIFAQNVLECGLINGLSAILVEMPKRPEGMTLAMQRELNIRPYFVHIEGANIIGWKGAMRQGQPYLRQVRLYEVQNIDADEFHTAKLERIRVLDLVTNYPQPVILDDGTESFNIIAGRRARFRVFERRLKNGEPTYVGIDTLSFAPNGTPTNRRRRGQAGDPEWEWVVIEEGIYSIDYIPFFPFYGDRAGFMTGFPVLEDLAYMNLTHWQSYSDQRNILHVARVPILLGKGFEKDEEGNSTVTLEVGANIAVYGPENCDLKYVEHQGAAIGAGQKDLENLEADMMTYGLEFLMTRPDRETATGRMIDHGEVNSPLKRIVDNLIDCLENCFKAVADFLDTPEEPKVKCAAALGMSPRDSASVANLIEMRKNREISHETFLNELQTISILADDLNIQEEIARVKKEQDDAAKLAEETAAKAHERELAVSAAAKPAPGEDDPSPPSPKPPGNGGGTGASAA